MATERSVVIFSQGTYGLPCTDSKRNMAYCLAEVIESLRNERVSHI